LYHLFSKFLHVLIMIGIVSGYIFLSYYYYKGYLSNNLFVSATIVVILSISALVILYRSAGHRITMFSKADIGDLTYVLPYLVFLSSVVEMRIFGHLGIFSIIALISMFIAVLFSKSSFRTALTGVLTLVMIIIVLYGVYTPSFGNDTWRDAIQATQIIERGGLKDLTVIHVAYPFPLVSILYAVYSMIIGLNTLWSSSFIGITYLLLLATWIHIFVKKYGSSYSHIAVILAMTTPLIVLWSVWFIPQTYSLLAAVPLIFLEPHPIVIIIYILALVMGHGGMALWTFIIIIFLVLINRILRNQTSVARQLKMKLIMFSIIFILYFSYTTISMILKEATTNVLEAILKFLSGEKIMTASANIQLPISAVLGAIPIIALVVLGLVAIIDDREIMTRLLAFASLTELGIAYIGVAAFPALDLPRYLGLGSVVLLTILSTRSLETLLGRGLVGAYYVFSLILLTIISFGFAGTLMPKNPYTANPYATWSISGLITYDEAQELRNLAPLFCCNNFLIDWRAGAYVGYKYLWIQPWYRGFRDLNTGSLFTFAGSYGLLITPKYLEQSKEILIFRRSAFEMLEAYSTDVLKHIYLMIYKQNTSVYYFSGNFIILKLNVD